MKFNKTDIKILERIGKELTYFLMGFLVNIIYYLTGIITGFLLFLYMVKILFGE